MKHATGSARVLGRTLGIHESRRLRLAIKTAQVKRVKIRTLIVDDEPLARERIRNLARKEADLEIVAECADGAEAVAAIRKHKPDLIFLDVQRPEVDGFGVGEQIERGAMAAVVFVTAHDRFALRAFEVHALD